VRRQLKKGNASSSEVGAVTASISAKNSFHIVGHDHRGAIVLRQKWSRGEVETRRDVRLSSQAPIAA
jgi:hypothetical protein